MKQTPAVRIAVVDGYQCGSLKMGWRSYPVRITQMNSVSFTAQIEPKIAARFKVSNVGVLRFQDTDWQIAIISKWVRQDGLIELELQLVQELFKQSIDKAPFLVKNRTRNLMLTDPLLPLTIFFAIFLTFLVMPGIGGRWGTSSLIIQWTEDCFRVVRSLFRS
ncbi:MAG: hypothetical protein FJ308_23005 [Planctomycetes bacterium]|nr:hypothetical protein [Planctomycetota bacterium]